jgi:hypothetical protein
MLATEHNPTPFNTHPIVREYYAMLDHTGRRVDASSRPELSLGSYEFLAPETYANAAATCAAPSSSAPPCLYQHAASCCALHAPYVSSTGICLLLCRYPSVLFLIDVSHQAVASGFSDAVVQSVRQCIADMQYLKTRVGIAM